MPRVKSQGILGAARFSPYSTERRRYEVGTHGFRRQEQHYLSELGGPRVSGSTHESEHTIGYNVLAPDLRRGASTQARALENAAPAYQESRPFHRDHVGTGTQGNWHGEGVSSLDYRNWQRSLLRGGDVSSAVQLNQLYYAHSDPFGGGDHPFMRQDDRALHQADLSFSRMVSHMRSVRFEAGGTEREVPVSDKARVEMALSRQAARTGVWPLAEIRKANEEFGK